MRVIAILSIAAMLAACAATGPAEYGAASDGKFGYSETKIENDRYRIVYRGSGDMPQDIVQDYALKRAGELALADGYDWFRVVGSDVSSEERGGVSVGAGFGTGSYGRGGGVSVGAGGDLGRLGAQEFFTARIDVLFGKGETPDDGAYDARSVVESIGGGAAAE